MSKLLRGRWAATSGKWQDLCSPPILAVVAAPLAVQLAPISSQTACSVIAVGGVNVVTLQGVKGWILFLHHDSSLSLQSTARQYRSYLDTKKTAVAYCWDPKSGLCSCAYLPQRNTDDTLHKDVCFLTLIQKTSLSVWEVTGLYVKTLHEDVIYFQQ